MSNLNGYSKALLAGAINWRGHILEETVGGVIVPGVTIISRDRASVEWLLTIGGESEWRQDRNGKRWLWRCHDDEAMDIIKATRPWLKSQQKRNQADLLINLKLSQNGKRLSDLNPHIRKELREARGLDRD